jgi:thiopeptide-type bacteriocin biosynthesis protein
MKRTFILGDEWLYYKIYCGKRAADMVLVACIKPLTETLLTNKLIDQWFFIRYSDPNPHLRIRFHCNHINKLGIIIDNINKALSNYVENDLIWKVQTDTYSREIERYGENTIEEAEQLFFHDSVASIEAMSFIEDDELLFLFALKSIDDLLTTFKYDLKDKIAFSKENSDYFRQEFNADTQLSKELYKKHQKLRTKIESFMNTPVPLETKVLFEIIKKNSEKTKSIKKNILQQHRDNALELPLNSFVSSCIHMMINRKFRDKQRLFELLCYDYLYRYYSRIFAKK